MGEDTTCPRCGGQMEKGFAYAPKGLYWDVKEHKYTLPFFNEAEGLIVGIGTIPKTECLRCRRCRLVLFRY